MKYRNGVQRGFTLVELLVVIGIIAVLIAILLPSLSKARESSNRIKCASNIRQLVAGAIMHANDTPRRPILFPNSTGANDTLAHIIPRYVNSPDVAVCPSTANTIRHNVIYANSLTEYGQDVLQDVHRVATSAGAGFGHSYEIFGWYDGPCIFPDATVIDGASLGDSNAQLGLKPGDVGYLSTPNVGPIVKRLGALRGPTTTILILDSDQDSSSDWKKMNNWPDGNNHKEAGLNIGFGDGHVEWIPRGPQIIETYMKSYQSAAMDQAFMRTKLPGLRINNVTVNGKQFTHFSVQ